MQNAAFNEEDLYYTDASVGEILRRTREHYSQSVRDIERSLRIRASQIEAMESDEFEKLPGRVYAIGFVRAYAEYLNLDGDRMVNLFKNQGLASTKGPSLDFPVAASEGKLPHATTIIACIVLIASVFSLWMSMKPASIAPLDNIPSVNAEVAATDTATDAQSAAISAETQSAQEMPAEPAPDPIILSVIKDSWVEVRDANQKALVSRVLKAGEQYSIPAREGLKLSMGNAGGITLSLQGEDVGPMGREGEVLRAQSLDMDALIKRYAPQKLETASGQEAENTLDQVPVKTEE